MHQRIAIIGAGPIGLEAAALLETRGFDQITVFERASVGASLRRWKHVSFFSPWALNRSEWGAARVPNPVNPELFPSGAEFIEEYLGPLANSLEKTRILEDAEVLGVARRDALKSEFIGHLDRKKGPFVLHVLREGKEHFHEADVVIDASGVYGDPANMGPGGLPALGENAFADRIERYLPDVLGAERAHYAGKRSLVVGGGYSAITTLKNLLDLKSQAPATQITWLLRGDTLPYEVLENDSLPERKALAQFGNTTSEGGTEGTAVFRANAIHSLSSTDAGGIQVVTDGNMQSFVVDRIVSNVGYRPSLEMSRELQFHSCWASEGPMKLAASLLTSAGGDCLQQTSGGPALLVNPEPDFFVVGNKSYGRNSAFLLRIGCEQLEHVISLLSD